MANRLKVTFVTVDPDRDTPAVLKSYLSDFDARISGFTGAPAEIDRAAAAYRIHHRTVPLEGGGHTRDHSASILFFDADGTFVAPIGHGDRPERGLAALRRLLEPAGQLRNPML